MFFNLIFSFFCLNMPRRSQKNASRRKGKKSTKSLVPYAGNRAGSKALRLLKGVSHPITPGSVWLTECKGLLKSSTPMARELFTTLRYVESVVLQSNVISGLSNSAYVFSLNGLFDPNITGTGHQPRGYDQITPFYKAYTVFGVSIRIRSAASNLNVNADAVLCLRLKSALTSTSMAGMYSADFQEASSCMCWEADTQQAELDLGYVSIADLEGVPKDKVMSDDQYSAGVAGNPGQQPQLELYLASNSGLAGALGAARRYTVDLTYSVRFFQPNTLAQS